MVAVTAAAIRPRALTRVSAGGMTARVAVLAALAIAAAAYTFSNQDRGTVASFAVIYAMIALSLNVLIGYLGQLSLGHQGFVGVGALFAAYLSAKQGFPLPTALVGGVVMGALFALVLGLVALRISGLYLALVTLVFGLTLQESLFVVPSLTNGGAGQKADRPTFLTDTRSFFLVCLALLLVVFYFDRRLTSSKGGRALLALKENERVAEAFGVNVTAYKLLGFVFSGAVAGLAGGLFAFNTQQFNGNSYDLLLALTFVIMTVVGGAGSRVGVMIGGALFFVINPIFKALVPHIGFLLVGPLQDNSVYIPAVIGVLLLILTLVRFPGGIAQQLAPVLRWLSFKPFDVHAGKDTGPGAVEGSSVRA